jgi:protease-4
MDSFSRFLTKLALVALTAFALFAGGLYLFGMWHDEWSGYNASYDVSNGWCNVAIIPVHGDIITSPYYDEYGTLIDGASLDTFITDLRTAEYDSDILGAIISIDSYGGSPYAGEAMAYELLRSHLPTAAVVRDTAASSGYWAASGADRIFASLVSSVGSIGATMSYFEEISPDGEFIQISSGPFKDYGNPDKYITEEERALFQRDIDLLADAFVAAVARNRHLPEEQIRAAADGSSLPGPLALQAGLIDEIGDRESARLWLAGELQLDPEEVVLCE